MRLVEALMGARDEVRVVDGASKFEGRNVGLVGLDRGVLLPLAYVELEVGLRRGRGGWGWSWLDGVRLPDREDLLGALILDALEVGRHFLVDRVDDYSLDRSVLRVRADYWTGEILRVEEMLQLPDAPLVEHFVCLLVDEDNGA